MYAGTLTILTSLALTSRPSSRMTQQVLCPNLAFLTPILALMRTSGCWNLAMSGLPPNPTHMYDNTCCYLDQPGLPSALALMITNGSCSLAEVCPQLPYQACCQPQILTLPGSTAVQVDITHTRSQHLPGVLQPSLNGPTHPGSHQWVLTVSALTLTHGSCSLTGESPTFPYQVYNKPQLLHMLVSTLTQPDIMCLQLALVGWCCS